MNRSISIIKGIRQSFLKLTEDLSIEQLNIIPSGFNNNMIWNMGHVVAAQQGVCYKRSGLPIIVDDNYFEAYKPDSKPNGFVNTDGLEKIRELMITTVDQLEKDYNKGIFVNHPAWVTRYGVPIHDFEEALTFLPFHEGMHWGMINAQKRLILNAH